MTKIFLGIFFCISLRNLSGQTLCEPFQVIGLAQYDVQWQALFHECINMQKPFPNFNAGPSQRANTIEKFNIKKITETYSNDSCVKNEFFDAQGYTIYTSTATDTVNGVLYCNEFDENHLLKKIIYKNRHSLTGVRNEKSDTFNDVEEFKYDHSNRITQHKETSVSLTKSFSCKLGEGCSATYYKKPHSSSFKKNKKYDSNGNLIKVTNSNGRHEVFKYDSLNRIVKAAVKEKYMNAPTWSFFYNQNNLIDSVEIIYRAKSMGREYINLIYNEDRQLTRAIFHYAESNVYREFEYLYTNGQLTEIIDCPIIFKTCTQRKIYYNKSGLISRIEYLKDNQITAWYSYDYEFYPNP